MKRLVNKTSQQTLVPKLEVAQTFWSRAKGLLGRDQLASDTGLWIHPCNSVHTFFMRFAIDLVFVNHDFVVVKTLARVPPGRFVWPVWKATSVIELNEGFLDQTPIAVGEQLYVDHSLS